MAVSPTILGNPPYTLPKTNSQRRRIQKRTGSSSKHPLSGVKLAVSFREDNICIFLGGCLNLVAVSFFCLNEGKPYLASTSRDAVLRQDPICVYYQEHQPQGPVMLHHMKSPNAAPKNMFLFAILKIKDKRCPLCMLEGNPN